MRVRNKAEAAEAEAGRQVLNDWLGAKWGRCRDLAERSGLPRPTITMLRKGSIHQFTIDHALAIEYGSEGEIKAEQLLVSRRRVLLEFARKGTAPTLRLAA